MDSLAWLLLVPGAALLRYDFDVAQMQLQRQSIFIALVLVLQCALGAVEGLYAGRYSFGSFEEVAALTRTVVAVTVVAAVVNQVLLPGPIPRSVPFIAGGLALIAMCGTRYAWRLTLERTSRPTSDTSEPALVFGAGDGGQQLLTSMLRSPESPYLPVALLDDAPAKRQLRLRGIPVAGGRSEIAEAAERFGATVLIIAIPSASARVVRELSAAAAAANLEVRTLPTVGQLLGDLSVGDVRPVAMADLLGRHEIDTDLAAIAEYLTGRRVLVTGAGGSIGSELCRQIYRFAPATLIMVDRDESALHGVQLSIHGRALLDGDDLVVADIRDEARVLEVFETHRPEVVFHAAALKHLTLLERHPAEGVKTNVLGTLHVLQAAMATDVGRFVNISTDKAADPTSMLGYTKRIAERLTAWVAAQTDGSFLSVRFGNVLGSRGSVLTSFQAQIDAGGPVTVTDPEVTRYFMTVEEAVQLVIQAGAVGRCGEALVLDMGEPVRIADVAQRLIEESGRRIDIVYTGLRPGEKLHEVLRSAGEADHRPRHPLISHVSVPPLAPHHVMAVSVPTLVANASLLSAADGQGAHLVDTKTQPSS
ncbi:MAG: polysaccharide biosynthesis protein [Microthrixaceae bacterium]